MSTTNNEMGNEDVKHSLIEEAIMTKEINFTLIKKITASSLAIFVSLLVLYSSLFGQPNYLFYRSLILSVIIILTFMLYPLFKKKSGIKKILTNIIDPFLIFFVVVIQAYVLIDFEDFVMRQGMPTNTDVVFGFIYVLLVLEATRRTVGWILVILASLFLFHLLISDKLAWIFYGPPMGLSQIVDFVWMRAEGLYGVPIMSVFTYVIPFLIFASFLIRSGAGKFFINLALSITGKSIGGPAKASIVSSGFMGSINGSAVANVVGTGSFTIPLMKRTGYKSDFSGGVEAVASTGGQIMPPVMGAAAFILAQNLQMPYGELLLYALIPALLYYIALFFSVHLEAKRITLKPLKASEVPKLLPLLKKQGYLLVPLILIIICLFLGYSPIKAALWAIISLIPLTALRKETRLSLIQFVSALEDAVKDLIPIAIACAAAGLIIAGVNISGMGLKFAQLITEISQGQLWLTLILVMIAAVILGFGLPTTAVYVTVAVLLAPALQEMGLSALQAHMFAFYYGVVAAITPPIALASFAAASISKSPAMKTGLVGFRLGLAGFIIPYMFAYGPELLFQGSIFQIIIAFATAVIGVYLLSSSIIGYFVNFYIGFLLRVMLFATSIMMIYPGMVSSVIGLVIMLIVYQFAKKNPSNNKKVLKAG